MSFLDYFTDPVLRAPTWGTLLMCIASSLMGVILFLRKRSLLGESLSHAAYPGVVGSVFLFALFFPIHEEWVFLAVLAGAFLTSMGGLFAIEWLEKVRRVPSDTALCAVLSFFFGIGVVLMSGLQGTFPAWQRQVQMLLFGQAATMTDFHVGIYAILAVLVILFFCLMFRPLQTLLFDPEFAKSLGLPVKKLEKVLFALLLLSLIVGIRSVGIVLISAMAIAPAVAARQYSNRLKTILFLSAFFGALSGLIGNILSVETALPTGPMIVLTGAAWALFSLLFAPQRGWICRMWRIARFRMRVKEENLLKALWKKPQLPASDFNWFTLFRLERQGWMVRKKDLLELTPDGKRKAVVVVRLHRLWELYLTQTLGCKVDEVHGSAEEMEHILTPDLEARLTAHLSNPKLDPHQQPIPEKYL